MLGSVIRQDPGGSGCKEVSPSLRFPWRAEREFAALLDSRCGWMSARWSWRRWNWRRWNWKSARLDDSQELLALLPDLALTRRIGHRYPGCLSCRLKPMMARGGRLTRRLWLLP